MLFSRKEKPERHPLGLARRLNNLPKSERIEAGLRLIRGIREHNKNIQKEIDAKGRAAYGAVAKYYYDGIVGIKHFGFKDDKQVDCSSILPENRVPLCLRRKDEQGADKSSSVEQGTK